MDPPAIPHITQGFYPLPNIIETYTRHVLNELVSLAEILPSMSNVDKKRSILDWLLRSRTYTIRLLILARWVHFSPLVHRCIDVVAFLQGQKFCYQNLVHVLQTIRFQMSFARLRNADLLTALDLLSTGTNVRLLNAPSSRTYVLPRNEISTKQVLQALRTINMILRIRLDLHEVIPSPFRKFVINNGRCTFTVPNEFSISMTTNSQDPSSNTSYFQWFAVDFNFLLPNYSSTPSKFKQLVEHHVNEQIALRLAEQKPILPLVYNIVHKFCIFQRLNLLSQEAFQLSRQSWLGHLRTIYEESVPQIRLYYWPQLTMRKDGKVIPSNHYICLCAETEDTPALEHILSTRKSNCEYEHISLKAKWYHNDELETISLDASTSTQVLLLKVTEMHARLILGQIQKELHPKIFSELTDNELKIRLFDRDIIVKVNSVSGRLVLLSSNSPLSPPRYLRAAEKNIALSSQSASQILNRLYFFCIQTELTEVASCADLSSVQGYISFPELAFTKKIWRRKDDLLWILSFNVETMDWSVKLVNFTGQIMFSQGISTTEGSLTIESFHRLAYLLEIQSLLYDAQSACYERRISFEYLPTPSKALIENNYTPFVRTGSLSIHMPTNIADLCPLVFIRAHDGFIIFEGRIMHRPPFKMEVETFGTCTINWKKGRFTVRGKTFNDFEQIWKRICKVVSLSKTNCFEVNLLTLRFVDFTYLKQHKFRVTIIDDGAFSIYFFDPESPFQLIAHYLKNIFTDNAHDMQPLKIIMERTKGILEAQQMGYTVLARSLREYRILFSARQGIQVSLNRFGCVLQDVYSLMSSAVKSESSQSLAQQWEPCQWLNSVWEGDLGDDELNGQVEASPELHLLKTMKTADLSAIIKKILSIPRKY
ncbi:mediator complex subunit Pmc1 [Schizosaccharomyces cryophilus OY26]|uniref:Mediator of RNA polymerase II transcription subunit 14 n=1 Tax=Schizosaccharomyces cryophilus (strain OY26 / ATCC MYA-4695 / CBS 11777 / NBRC 106824 / NRRL Y48691) TaxID=653667 RepID=S9W8F6_SCHCR|nr:mediator complex subunit Pmc1 [Schizosaccharomyces cryophilus OY26]EPY54125.1 mediator complex subunit Pmc1 [Schizosaccharomyces cryophilus OY26]